MTDTGPLFVSSGDLIADRRYNAAIELASRGDLPAAADILAQTVEIVPRFATAWFALGAIRDRLGDRDGAVAAFSARRDTDPEDYHGARLQLARLGSGDAAPAMTETYVRRLFDQYAQRYDTALTEHLNYRGPAILRGAVEAAMGAAGRPMHFASVLDLGCGTGLGGAAFRPFADRLIGVDLSPAMIAQATAKGIYDRLTCANMADFLAEERPRRRNIDLVLAADVFVYVNDLAPVIAAVAVSLRRMAFLPSPWRPIPATARSCCRRCVSLTASHFSAMCLTAPASPRRISATPRSAPKRASLSTVSWVVLHIEIG